MPGEPATSPTILAPTPNITTRAPSAGQRVLAAIFGEATSPKSKAVGDALQLTVAEKIKGS